MSRKKLPVGGQDGDNAVRGMVTLSANGNAAPYTPTAPATAAPVDLLTVRTVRQHDTTDGMKMPGDEYQRDNNEAHTLQAQGIVQII